jgi:4-hydroxy-4-methyl-2-oxoglutarate aldolase
MVAEDVNVARLRKLDTAAVSDALDKHDIPGQCLGIKSLDHGFRMAGRAFTVLYRAAGDPPGSVGDYIDDVQPGQIVVLDNQGKQDATVWGDILSSLAHHKGIAGTVIDGACRDINVSLELGYPLYSRSVSMRTGKDRVEVASYEAALNIGGAVVWAGDLLFGDADGVVCIPQGREEEILATAEKIVSAEDEIRTMIRAGKRLDEAREEQGYHTLQTADTERD